MLTAKRRCWVCRYLLWTHPFTQFQRWFYTKEQAEAFMQRQHGVMLSDVRHV